MKTVYRHCGDTQFNPDKLSDSLKDIRNIYMKPTVGLWSSPKNSDLSWENWCRDEEFCLESLGTYFDFTLKDSANIYKITDLSSLKKLIQMFPGKKIDSQISWMYKPSYEKHSVLKRFPDFKAISKKYDGVELSLSSDYSLYYWMYGWDVDTLVTWNPDVVEIL